MSNVVRFPGAHPAADFPAPQAVQLEEVREMRSAQRQELEKHLASVLEDFDKSDFSPNASVLTVTSFANDVGTNITKLGDNWDVAGIILGVERAKYILLNAQPEHET